MTIEEKLSNAIVSYEMSFEDPLANCNRMSDEEESKLLIKHVKRDQYQDSNIWKVLKMYNAAKHFHLDHGKYWDSLNLFDYFATIKNCDISLLYETTTNSLNAPCGLVRLKQIASGLKSQS